MLKEDGKKNSSYSKPLLKHFAKMVTAPLVYTLGAAIRRT